MAIIQLSDNKQLLALGSNHMFGRRRDKVDTVFTDSAVSSLHASIQWTGDQWEIVSVGRNGTWLNDLSLEEGTRYRIKPGDRIFFSSPSSNEVVVKECSPPSAVLVNLSKDYEVIAVLGYQTISECEDASAAIFKGNNGAWYLEKQFQKNQLNNGEYFDIGSQHYLFLSPPIHQLTEMKQSRSRFDPVVKFDFKVSLNQEHIQLQVAHGHKSYNLGERSHHQLLLILGREYIVDKKNSLPKSDCGWLAIADIAQQLRTDHNHINIMIHRARKQFISTLDGHPFAVDWIERRSGEVRIGIDRISIDSGDETDSSY